MTRWEQARRGFLRFGRRRQASPVPADAAVVGDGVARGDVAAEAFVPEASTDGGRRDAAVRPERPAHAPAGAPSTSRSHALSVCIASGKGGTGKSTVSAALAALFARRGRTLLLDADLGCANAHILQGARPEHSFADVLHGDVAVRDIVTPCPSGVDLLAGGSGYASLAGLRSYELEMIGRGLSRLEPEYDHLVVDSAAGLSRQTVAFAVASDLALLVTTPDLTAMTDAYAFLKVFARQCAAQSIERPMPLLVVNRATSEEEAAHVASRLQEVVAKFLGERIELLAVLPEDRAAYRCAQSRTTVVGEEPDSELGRALLVLSNGVLSRLARVSPEGRSGWTAGRRLADSAASEMG